MAKIIRIDSDKCNGCGACAEACAEGAIRMIDGKAVLLKASYCDGLGACLPVCPTDAISLVDVPSATSSIPVAPSPAVGIPVSSAPMGGIPMACPGSGARRIVRDERPAPEGEAPGRLSQWPVQLRLVPSKAPFFDGADLLVAADCSAFAHGSFHERFIKGRTVVIGCPKLDPRECWSKLADIVAMNDIRSITVTRMDVPCCSVIVEAVRAAVMNSGKEVPVEVFTIYADGSVTGQK